MDCLTFIAELVKAIAWPIAIIVIVFVLRDPLLSLLRELKRLKWKDVELEFEKGVREVKAQLPSPPTRPSGPWGYDDEDRLLNLVEISPKAAVLDAWGQVEGQLVALFKRRNLELPTRISPVQMSDTLQREKLLDQHGLWLFNSLRQLRNRAAHEHETEITDEGALDFIVMASDLLRSLKKI